MAAAERGRLVVSPPQAADVCWRGASGGPYRYEIFDITAPPRCHSPANFIYARREADRTWTALYVGATTSLEQQFAGGRSQPFIIEHGVTHVHVHASAPDADSRAFEVRDLVAYWQPLGNPTFDSRGHQP